MRRTAILTLAASLMVSGANAAPDTQALDLNAALQTALQRNSALAGARAQVQASGAAVKQAEAASGPSAAITSGYGFLSKETTFGGTPVLERNTVANRIAVQQVIYSGGGVRAAIDRARHGSAASLQAAEAVQAEILSGVSVAYFNAIQARDSIAAATSSVQSLQASVDAAQKLRDAGVVTNADVLRAQVALSTANENLINAQNAHAVALANLKNAMGVPQSEAISITGDYALPQQIDQITPAKRPEVAARESAVNAALAAKRAAEAGKLPTVALAADFYNEPVGSQFPRRTNTLGAGILVNLNVFDSGLTRARVDEADALARSASQGLNEAVQLASLQVETARLDLSSACARLQTTANQVASAEESLRVLQAGYREGITPLTDVLAAESALTGARFARISAETDVRVAEVNLLKALGRTDILLRQERK